MLVMMLVATAVPMTAIGAEHEDPAPLEIMVDVPAVVTSDLLEASEVTSATVAGLPEMMVCVASEETTVVTVAIEVSDDTSENVQAWIQDGDDSYINAFDGTFEASTSEETTKVAWPFYLVGGAAGEYEATIIASTETTSFSLPITIVVEDEDVVVEPEVLTTSIVGVVNGASYTTTRTISFTVAGNEGTATTFFGINAPATIEATAPVTVSEVGTYTVNFFSVDDVTTEPTKTVQFFIKEADPVDPVVPVLEPTVSFSGGDRFETAVLAAKKAFPAGADNVVIATGRNWPDALGGSALAGAVDGPIILVEPNKAVPSVVASYLAGIEPEMLYILGGTAAVSDAVAAELAEMSVDTTRVAGANRYETANLIAEKVIDLQGDDYDGYAFVATGGNFPDALAAGPLAASQKWPLFLANPRTGISAETSAAMAAVDHAVVLGGTAAVSAAVENKLKADGIHVDRLQGANRYETAVAVANWAVSKGYLYWTNTGIATGENFPDALAGGIAQAKFGGVMLLTRPASLHTATAAALTANKAAIDSVVYYGGTSAISANVRAAVHAIVH